MLDNLCSGVTYHLNTVTLQKLIMTQVNKSPLSVLLLTMTAEKYIMEQRLSYRLPFNAYLNKCLMFYGQQISFIYSRTPIIRPYYSHKNSFFHRHTLFHEIHFNIILTSKLISSKFSFSSRFMTKLLSSLFISPNVCNTYC